jgi:SAM-dependent methyltransferase
MAQLLKRVAPFSSILDIGAGMGTDLDLAHKASPSAALFAVESYAPAIEVLRRKGVEVCAMNVERGKLPFDNEAVDVIMANQVMEHMKEIFWIMHEVSRTLKIGGHLIIGVPNLASLHNRLLLLAGRQPTSIRSRSAHVRGYTRTDVVEFLEVNFPGGYELKEVLGSNFYPLPPFIAEPMAKVFGSLAVSIFLLIEKKKPYAGEFLEYPVNQRLETNFFLGESSGNHNHAD